VARPLGRFLTDESSKSTTSFDRRKAKLASQSPAELPEKPHFAARFTAAVSGRGPNLSVVERTGGRSPAAGRQFNRILATSRVARRRIAVLVATPPLLAGFGRFRRLSNSTLGLSKNARPCRRLRSVCRPPPSFSCFHSTRPLRQAWRRITRPEPRSP